MNDMFNNAVVFNKDISGWNTSSVINMSGMLKNAQKFNQSLNSWNWDTSNVTNMDCMFKNAKTFDQNIQIWNTLKVINFTNMFESAVAMYSSYYRTTGYGDTPTQEFFNQSI